MSVPDVNGFGLHSLVHDRRIERSSNADGCTMMVMSAANSPSTDSDSKPAAFIGFNRLQEDAVGPEPGCFDSDFFDGPIDI